MEKRKFLTLLGLELRLCRAARSQSLYRLSYHDSHESCCVRMTHFLRTDSMTVLQCWSPYLLSSARWLYDMWTGPNVQQRFCSWWPVCPDKIWGPPNLLLNRILGQNRRTLKIIYFFFIISGVGLSPLGTAATSGLLYKPQMIDEGDCGAIGGLKIGRGNRSTRRKPAPALPCPPQIPLDQTRARNRAAAVGSQRLTVWAMARPLKIITSM
jgi:hypothetical protein